MLQMSVSISPEASAINMNSPSQSSSARRRGFTAFSQSKDGSGSLDYSDHTTPERLTGKVGSFSRFSRESSTHSIYSKDSPPSSPRFLGFSFFGQGDNGNGESTSMKNIRKAISFTIPDGGNDESNGDSIEFLRLGVKDFLQNSLVGQIYNHCLLLMSIFSCLQFLVHTYNDEYPRSSNNNVGNGVNGDIVEFIIACIFAMDWALSLFIADHKGIFLTSFFSMVDLLTVIPTFVMASRQCPYLDDVHTGDEVVSFILCGIKMTRILRILRLHKRFTLIEDEIQRFLANMALNIVVMIIFNSAVMHYLEPDQAHSFHTWVYYMIVTCTTVGYGDISPKSDWGRFAAMTMISFAIITVPSMTNELISKMSQQSIYARAKYIPKTRKSRHVLICGDSSSSSLQEFFEELFHEDHDVTNLHAVILQPGYPNNEVKKLLKDIKYQQCLTYLDGTAMNEQDLRRACAIQSKAIFILANKFTTNPDEEDAKTILQQYSIRRFFNLYSSNHHSALVRKVGSEASPNASKISVFGSIKNTIWSLFLDDSSGGRSSAIVCMQLLSPDNRRHVAANSSTSNRALLGGGDSMNEHLVVCLNETKMGVIAKACIFQGTNTLIMNLLSSFADNDDDGPAANDNDDISILDEDQDSGDWFGEYQRGCTWEIYTSELSPAFEGITFCALSEVLYAKLGVVLFGLEVEDLPKENKDSNRSSSKYSKKLVLNPGSYVLPTSRNGNKRLTGLIIAQNKAQSDVSFKDDDADSLLQRSVDFRQLTLLANSTQAGASGSGILPHGRRRSLLSFGPRGSFGRRPSRSIVSRGEDETCDESVESKENCDPVPREGGNIASWRSLLRNYEKTKTSEQLLEELQRKEENHMKQNYYLRHRLDQQNRSHMHKESIVDVKDVTISTNVVEELPFIKEHIIITGKSLNNLYDCIRPLRAKNLGPLKHIVILFPREFPQLVWQKISVFESIWIVRGSSLEDSDLKRCGIFRAKQVLLLADSSAAAHAASESSSSSMASSSQGNDFSADADIIFSYHAVKRLNPALHVVVEMVRPSNMHYLTATSSDERNSTAAVHNNYKFTPQFASGSLFLTSFLDTLVCQSFYNTRIVDIVHKMIVGNTEDEMEENRQNMDETKSSKPSVAAFASGAFSPNNRKRGTISDVKTSNPKTPSPTRKSIVAPGILPNPTTPKSVAAVSPTNSLKGSSLYQIPIPEGLTNRTYGALYKLLASRNMIPLGLLRGVLSSTNVGPKGNKAPYVYTNPNPDTEIFLCDRVFVLAQHTPTLVRPGGSPSSTDGFEDDLMNSTMRKKKTSTDDVLTALNAMKKDVDQFQEVQRQFEFRLQQMHGDCSQSIATAISLISQSQDRVQPIVAASTKDQKNVRFRSGTMSPSSSMSVSSLPPQSIPPISRSLASSPCQPRFGKSPSVLPSSPILRGNKRMTANHGTGVAFTTESHHSINKDDNTTIATASVRTLTSDLGYSLTTPVKTESVTIVDNNIIQPEQQCGSDINYDASMIGVDVQDLQHLQSKEDAVDVLSMNSSVPSSLSVSPSPTPPPYLTPHEEQMVNVESSLAKVEDEYQKKFRPMSAEHFLPHQVYEDHEHASAVVSAPVTFVVRPKSANRGEFHF